MNKDIKLMVSISDICIAYGCLAMVTCAVGCIAYKLGQAKTKLEIVGILSEYLSDTKTK